MWMRVSCGSTQPVARRVKELTTGIRLNNNQLTNIQDLPTVRLCSTVTREHQRLRQPQTNISARADVLTVEWDDGGAGGG